MKNSTLEVIDDANQLIRIQNDQARRERVSSSKTKSVPCKVVFSATLKQLGCEQMRHMCRTVANQEIAQDQVHIYSEHDFGLVRYGTDKLIWTIDYVSKKTGFSAEDPADLEDTVRVLSIMYDHEY